MKSVLTLTLNPAVDVSTATDRLEPHAKLRCTEPRFDAGGGGINVARTIGELGGQAEAFVPLAGGTGEILAGLLDDAGIPVHAFQADGETRQNIQVHVRDDDAQYRFVMPGPRQSEETGRRMLREIDRLLATGRHDYVVASGSLAPGLPEDSFARLAAMARDHEVRLLVDTSGAALRSVLDTGVFLIKPDKWEATTLGHAEGGDPDQAARSLVTDGAAQAVVLTRGDEGARLVSAEGATDIRPPEVQVTSTAGAGDTFMGAMVHALAEDWPLVEAVRFGVAGAAAAVTTPATALARREAINRLYGQMGPGGR